MSEPNRPAPTAPLVAVIVLNWNNWPVTVECLESLRRATYAQCRVLLVDNGSSDDSEKVLRARFPDLELLQTGANLGYAGGNNAGMRRALKLGADYLCLLNNDVVVEPDFLEPLVAAMEADPQLGIVGGLQCSYSDRRIIETSGAYFNLFTGRMRNANAGEVDQGQCNQAKSVDFICGAALLARASLALAIGLLDERFFLVAEDADWCLRARRAGWAVRYIPGSKIYHRVAATRESQPRTTWYYTLRNVIWLVRRHASWAQFLVYLALYFAYFCPKVVLGRLVKGESHLMRDALRGIRDGFRTPLDDAAAANRFAAPASSPPAGK
ncbi:MAG TPA: glycosyltransferase family 2 protein [Candidatus Acidoferrales bacterium]|nr:glycosyltransferase family 2 protein [Candidatus Acidoferrales bacterium]